MLASTRRRLEMGARALEFSRQQPNPSAGYAAAVARIEERLTRAKVVERQEVCDVFTRIGELLGTERAPGPVGVGLVLP